MPVPSVEMASPKQLTRHLQADPAAYAESVGKHEKRDLAEIVGHDTGEGTVVRLFMGATEEMPLRGLGYVAAATEIAGYIPHEQLQVIFVSHLGERVNNIDHDTSSQQAELLASLGRRYLEVCHPDRAGTVMFGTDGAVDLIDELRPDVEEIIHADDVLADRLGTKGDTHGSDYAMYGAAHVAYQETAALTPEGLTDDEPEAVIPERIVSVGCQQEHPFYKLRMAARKSIERLELVTTGQIFTRHLIPPYYSSRGGEQSLEDAIANGPDPSMASEASVRRDIDHLLATVPVGELL